MELAGLRLPSLSDWIDMLGHLYGSPRALRLADRGRRRDHHRVAAASPLWAA
jgi:hypothetical protein